MIYNLRVTNNAELHVLEACMYYEGELAGLSERFLSEIEEAYNKLAEHPQYYSFIAKQTVYRDISLNKFPYTIVFQIYNQDVIIIDVFNTHRKPEY